MLSITLTQHSLPKVTVLFNINFAPPISPNQTYTVRGRTNILFSFWKRFIGITVLPTMRIYPHMCRFRFFPTFVNEKTETKWEYILYERVWEIFLEISLHFFQNLRSAYIFINCANLWKFVIIVFNTYLNFIKISNTSTIFWKASTIQFE